jgi:hypothetical protein
LGKKRWYKLHICILTERWYWTLIKNDFFKEFLKVFFMTRSMLFSKIFYNFLFECYNHLNHKAEKKVTKNYLKISFCNFLFHLFDSNAHNFKTENRRGLPTGLVACGRLVPLLTPHAICLWVKAATKLIDFKKHI